jgi:hypothetical protein
MPGFLVHVGANVTCAHGAPAQPTVPNPRVLVSSAPTTLQTPPYVVTACPFNVAGAPSPCVTGTWVRGALRVRSNSVPLLLMDSHAVCVPNATPLLILQTQTRVRAT